MPFEGYPNGLLPPNSRPCLTVSSSDIQTGQLTLSQDRCYLGVAGLDVPHGVELLFPRPGANRPTFAQPTQDPWGEGYMTTTMLLNQNQTEFLPFNSWGNPRLLYTYGSTLSLNGIPIYRQSPFVATAATDVPRAVAIGSSVVSTDAVEVEPLPFLYTANGITNGFTGPDAGASHGTPAGLWSQQFSFNQLVPQVPIDVASAGGSPAAAQTVNGICFAVDQSSGAAYAKSQHLFSVVSASNGPVRFCK